MPLYLFSGQPSLATITLRSGSPPSVASAAGAVSSLAASGMARLRFSRTATATTAPVTSDISARVRFSRQASGTWSAITGGGTAATSSFVLVIGGKWTPLLTTERPPKQSGTATGILPALLGGGEAWMSLYGSSLGDMKSPKPKGSGVTHTKDLENRIAALLMLAE